MKRQKFSVSLASGNKVHKFLCRIWFATYKCVSSIQFKGTIIGMYFEIWIFNVSRDDDFTNDNGSKIEILQADIQLFLR